MFVQTLLGRQVHLEFLALGVNADVVLLDLQLGDESDPKDNVQRLRRAGYKVLVYSIAAPWV